MTELEAEKRDKIGKSKTLDRFIGDIQSRPRVLVEFDDLWLAVIDKVVVQVDGKLIFIFRNGTEIKA